MHGKFRVKITQKNIVVVFLGVGIVGSGSRADYDRAVLVWKVPGRSNRRNLQHPPPHNDGSIGIVVDAELVSVCKLVRT